MKSFKVTIVPKHGELPEISYIVKAKDPGSAWYKCQHEVLDHKYTKIDFTFYVKVV